MNNAVNDASAATTNAAEVASFAALRMAAADQQPAPANNTFGNVVTSFRQPGGSVATSNEVRNSLLLNALLRQSSVPSAAGVTGDNGLRLLQNLVLQKQQQQQATEARIALLTAGSTAAADTGGDLVLQQLMRLYQQQQQQGSTPQQGLSALLGGSSSSSSASALLDHHPAFAGLRGAATSRLQQHQLSGSAFGQAQQLASSLALPAASVLDIIRAMNGGGGAAASTNHTSSNNQAAAAAELPAMLQESAEMGHKAGLSPTDIATTRSELVRQFRLRQIHNSAAAGVVAERKKPPPTPQQGSLGGGMNSNEYGMHSRAQQQQQPITQSFLSRTGTSELFHQPAQNHFAPEPCSLELIDKKSGASLFPDPSRNGPGMIWSINANNTTGNNDASANSMKRKAEGPPTHVVTTDVTSVLTAGDDGAARTNAAAAPLPNKTTTKAIPITKKKRRVILNSRLSNIQEKEIPHFSRRSRAPLGIEEDQNWLSEFQCFARAEMMEVFQATETDVVIRSTSKSVKLNQVGVRCRFCAHLPHGDRVNRSSAFPSRLDKLYQSFNMMVRDHFAHCTEIPEDIWGQYLALKAQNSQGACDSRHYWFYAAQKLGMVDTDSKKGGAAGNGLEMSESTQAEGQKMPPYGSTAAEPGVNGEAEAAKDGAFLSPPPSEDLTLVRIPGDKDKASPFLYELLSHIQVVRLIPPERVGKRKTLPLGLEGIGCRYCYKVGRLGFSRCYPLRRRGLPAQIYDMHNHLQRCTVCPNSVKDVLRQLLDDQKKKSSAARTIEDDDHTKSRGANSGVDPAEEAEYMEIIWSRLGRMADLTTS